MATYTSPRTDPRTGETYNPPPSLYGPGGPNVALTPAQLAAKQAEFNKYFAEHQNGVTGTKTGAGKVNTGSTGSTIIDQLTGAFQNKYVLLAVGVFALVALSKRKKSTAAHE